MRVIFLGTPDFAVKILNALCKSEHEVVAVVCQPDRINGRNNKIVPCPVKRCAEQKGLTVLQFGNISAEGESVLRGFCPDIMVTCAYGQILKQNILDICPIFNVHASLLPKYRGSSPVQWALMNGEKEVGVTVMKTELGVDTGDMILKKSTVLSGDENSDEVLEKLSVIGAGIIVEALNKAEKGELTFEKQNESEATHCRMLVKGDGVVDFRKSAEEIKNFIRGVTPWPSAQTTCLFGKLKILKAEEAEAVGGERCGEIIVSDAKNGLIVKCGSGYLRLLTIQAEGGKAMDAKAYLLGHRLPVGSVLGE